LKIPDVTGVFSVILEPSSLNSGSGLSTAQA